MAQQQYWSHNESYVIESWYRCLFSDLEFLTHHGSCQFRHSERRVLAFLFQEKQDK